MRQPQPDDSLDHLSRRSVLKGAGALTGLVLCLRVSGAIAAEGEEAKNTALTPSRAARSMIRWYSSPSIPTAPCM